MDQRLFHGCAFFEKKETSLLCASFSIQEERVMRERERAHLQESTTQLFLFLLLFYIIHQYIRDCPTF